MLQVVENPNKDRMVVEPTKGRVDRVWVIALTVFWVLFTSFAVWATYAATITHSVTGWIWAAMAAIPVLVATFALIQARAKEIIEIDDERISIHIEGGIIRDSWSAGAHELVRVELGCFHHNPAGDYEGETIPSLNLVRNRGFLSRRRMVAVGLHPDEKAKVFDTLSRLLRQRGYRASISSTYPPHEERPAT